MAVVIGRHLRKRFGKFTAVDDVDLEIPEGICFGLLGPNGAGKTTTIRMIQGVSPLDGGELQVLGGDMVKDPRPIKQRLGVVPQEDNLDPDFTVRNNLIVYGRFFGIPRSKSQPRADELLRFMDLEDKRDERIDALSGGMKRRLVVARALVNDPDLLILDEPTTGLDPQARHALWETIRRLRRQGKTILLTTHYMDEAQMLCDTLVIMDHGKILEQGTPRDLIGKHCGKEALELVAEDDVLDALEKQLRRRRHERLGDRIIVLGNGLEAKQHELVKRYSITEAVLRRATLEDVFLRLTGRALRE